jgi:PAS domain S-box-containing protein
MCYEPQAGAGMLSYKKQIFFLITVAIICVALVFSIYTQIRKNAFRTLYERQMSYAKLATEGIQGAVSRHITLLRILASDPDVIAMNAEGKALLKAVGEERFFYVKEVARLDARGKIIYTFPDKMHQTGKYISHMPHVQQALASGKLAVSDVFVSADGVKSIALHVPVYSGRTPDGMVATLISLEDLGRNFLGKIHVPGERHAKLLTPDGEVVYCSNTLHRGMKYAEIYKDNPQAAAMVALALQGKSGRASFMDRCFSADAKKTERVHAVYTPARVGEANWSVIVVSSEKPLMPELQGIKRQIFILILLLAAFFMTAAYVAARIRSAAAEAQKRRKMEEDLIRSAEEINDLYNRAPYGYHSLDADGLIVRINDTELTLLGYEREEVIGRPHRDFLAPDDRPRFDTAFGELKKEGVLHELEYELVRKDGSSLTVLSSASALTDGEGNFSLARFIILDVTNRRLQAERLRESEELYRTAMEATSDGVTILQDGVYVYVNQKFLDTMGASSEDILHKPIGTLAGPHLQQSFKDFIARHPKETPVPERHVTRVESSEGKTVYLQSSSMDVIYRGRPAILTFIQDITDSKKVERALRESEALHRTALENTSDGISIIDIKTGLYLYANRQLMETIGRPEEDLTNRSVDTYVHPDDVGIGRRNYRSLQDGDQSKAYHEIRAIAADGSTVNLGVTMTEIRYQGKRAIISFITNITERKKAEEALRESEELYRTAMEKTNDGISIVQDGVYVYVNQKLLETIGRPGDEIVGKPLGIYTHPDDRKMLVDNYEARRKGDDAPADYDMRIIKPDGTMAFINIKSAVINYKGKPATFSFIQDITERKKTEEALRESEERYRSIIENIDDEYFETDLTGKITFFNKATSYAGYTYEEFAGMCYVQYTEPRMSKNIAKAFNTAYRENRAVRIMDHEIIRKDGGIIYLEISVAPRRGADGKTIGFQGISRDVTERHKMEEEQRKLTEQLSQAQKMEAIGTLAGGIAHDFNNLLMGIQGYASLMLLDTDATHPHHEQLNSIQTLVQSGATLTRQLLGFARAGRYEVVVADLNEMVSRSVQLFGRTKKEIRIFEKYASDLPNVEVDRGQIEQVLLNIFVNAWQAMPAGGDLYIETQNVTMDARDANLRELAPGRYVKLTVTDTGAGMDEKTRLRVFEPFFTTKEMGRGTGMGLASAYGIIKGHGGTITVYSEKGEGTTFNIYLPASDKNVHTDEAAELQPTGGTETILLVDDEEVVTEATGMLLEKLGYRVITAGGGREALDIYNQKHAEIDLVIIDMIMPGMSGSDTFDGLKGINPSIRAILSSGYSLNGKAQAIMDKGVRVFLQKPYRLQSLARAIRKALEG